MNRAMRAVCLGLGVSVHASGAVAVAGPLEVEAGASVMDFGYREFSDSGTLLDREDGRIPGLVARLGGKSGAWQFTGELSHHAGDVTYTGRTNVGGMVSTITAETVTGLSATLTRRIGNRTNPEITLYGGFGYTDWTRDIQPTTTAGGQPVAGLLENYYWWSGFVGSRLEMAAQPGVRFGAEVRLMRIIAPELEINFGGLYDDASLDLGEDWGMRLVLPARFRVTATSWLIVEPWIEQWEFGRSATATLTRNGTPAGTVFEPASETGNFGVSLLLSREW
jgi:hypothetical protein